MIMTPHFEIRPPVSIMSCRSHETEASASRMILNLPAVDSDKTPLRMSFSANADESHYELCYCFRSNPKTDALKQLFEDFNRVFRVKEHIKTKLKTLANLKENWDGYGAVAMERESLKNMDDVISAASNSDLTRWNLYPSTNGTLLLTVRRGGIGSICIGNDGYSYAVKVRGQIFSGSKQQFDTAAVVKLLKELSSMF